MQRNTFGFSKNLWTQSVFEWDSLAIATNENSWKTTQNMWNPITHLTSLNQRK